MLYMANIKNNCQQLYNEQGISLTVEEDKRARWGTNRSMKIIVHWTKIPTSSSRPRREWKFIKEAYTTKRYYKRYILSLSKRETKKSIKKIYVCTYLWIKKFPSLSQQHWWIGYQSFQIIYTRTFVFHRNSYKYLAGFSNFFFFFFFFSRY